MSDEHFHTDSRSARKTAHIIEGATEPALAVYVPASDRRSSMVVVSVTAEDHREATTVLRTRAECDAAIAQLVAARDTAFDA